jgi:zinc protease
LALALDGSKKADVVEEKIVQGAEETVDSTATATYERTPSTFDRTGEPPYGPAPEVKTPPIWEDKLSNGLRVLGIENAEVPLVDFQIAIDGGLLMEDIGKVGVSNLMAEMLTRGTKKKTPEQLEEAIQQLGATISVNTGIEEVTISVNTLAKNYDATLALVEEVLLEPRWDAKEFDLVKQSAISYIRQQDADPNSIAQNNFNIVIFGKDNIRSRNILGTTESVNSITLEDLKAYYAKAISPTVARMHVVGLLDKTRIMASLGKLDKNWAAKKVEIPEYKTPPPPSASRVYFYDVPDAKQSVMWIGYPALAATDTDFYPAEIMNYILGGGGFASQLTQQLREGKGYTYGIDSGFYGTKSRGSFAISSGVRSNVTLESAQLIKSILQDYPKNYSAGDLATTQGFLIKSNARAFETAYAKLSMLDNISKYGWKYDYVKGREQIVKGMTVERIREMSQKYLNADKMIWLVAGDAKTQLPRLKELGFGDPILIKK